MQGGARLCRRREDKQHSQQHGKKHLLSLPETLIGNGHRLGVRAVAALHSFYPCWEANLMFGVAFSVGMKGETDRNSTLWP